MATYSITSKDIHGPIGEPYPYTRAALARARAWLDGIAARYEQRRRYQRTVSELGALSDRILYDIGIGRHQIAEVARQLSQRRV